MSLGKIKLKLYNKGTLSYPIFEILISKLKKKGNLEKIGIYSPLNNIIFINTYRLAYWINKKIIINISLKKILIKYLKY